jgi:hypothetical protein
MSKLYLITNDKGRSIAYQKAIEALKRCPHPIRTFEVDLPDAICFHYSYADSSGNQSIALRETISRR